MIMGRIARRCRRGGTLVLLTLLLALPATAHPALWVLRDADTTVYLFGTVHLLPNDTRWRFPALETALTRSDMLYIEVTDTDPATLQPLILRLGLDLTHPLSGKLTAAELATLDKAAQTAGLPGGGATLEPMRPWLAGLTLAVAPLLKAGLDPAHGVDKLLQAQMIAAHKPVHGPETAAQQIHFLADLSEPVQLAFLRATLHDFATADRELRKLIDAWQRGDVAAIARTDDEQMRQRSPELYRRLLVQRNRKWATRIAALMQQPGTVFIAVGAAHLAGPDSVQAQLRKLGLHVHHATPPIPAGAAHGRDRGADRIGRARAVRSAP